MNADAHSSIIVTPCRWHEQREALATIRRTVFIDEQQVPPELEWDGEDEAAWHFLATVDGVPAGAARLLATGQIGRMCVLAAYRRRGIGKALLQQVEQTAREFSIKPLFLHAQTYIQAFYAGMGYRPEGEVFMDAGIPHIEMVKNEEASRS